MTPPPLYAASVPVFLHYLDRAEALVRRVRSQPDLLQDRLVPGMFSAAEQFATAAGFATRIACPLAGRPVPEFQDLGMSHDDLIKRISAARIALNDLPEQAFADAASRRYPHRAGFAELDQDADTFLHLFGMPNFMFHMTMGFAILRRAGVEIGKADFDGQHDYPPGFRF